jgi:hypothetical protein
MKMDENQMWEVIDLVITENVKEHEAIKSFGATSIQLTYSGIKKNSLHQTQVVLDRSTVRLMSIPTLRMFIVEVINQMRSEAE